MRFFIPLPPVTKKNSQQIVMVGGARKRPVIIPSKQYKKYEQEAFAFLAPPPEPVDYAVNVKCIYHLPTRRACDLTNLMEATHDILVGAKVLPDDNFKVIASVDGSRCVYDPGNVGTEIIIERSEHEFESKT